MSALDVLHVCYGGIGGHMGVVNALTKEFRRAGLASGVIAIGPREALDGRAESWPDMDRVEYLPIARRADLSSMAGAYRLTRSMPARVAFVHTHRHATPVAIGRLVGGQGGRVVTVEHQVATQRDVFADINSASSLVCSRAVVFLTAENRAKYPLRRLPFPALNHVVVIPNGIDLALYPSGPRTPRPRTGRPIIGMASRLVPLKDFDTLLRAVAVLRDRLGSRAPVLHIAGEGQEHARIEELIAAFGIDDDVIMLGGLTESQIPAFLESLDVYVQSTHGETLSMSLLEASAARTPIVASDITGVNNLLTDGVDALLCAPGDAGALADAVARVLDSEDRGAERAERARTLVSAYYTSTRMARDYLSLISRIDADGRWAEAAARLTLPAAR